MVGPDICEVDNCIKDIKSAHLDTKVKGNLQDFLGVYIDRKKYGSFCLTQPHLIDRIFKYLRLEKQLVAGK